MTELEIAEAIARGDLPSPQPLAGSWLIAMRISGTGVAYRQSLDEYCFRPPEIWLTDRMARRWLGAPVVLQHPDGGVLSSGEYQNSVLGAIVFTYIAGDELWGIARAFSNGLAAELIRPEGLVSFDTSPAVSFAADGVEALELYDGSRLLIEEEPELIDHLAIIVSPAGEVGGVWSKDDPTNVGIKESEDA